MPIYEQTYRRFEGHLVRRFRWLIIVGQELRVLLSMKVMVAFFLLGLVQSFLRIMQIVGVNMLMSNPNNPLTFALRSIDLLQVDQQMFFDYLRVQSGFVFLFSIAIGSGSICNDFRYNLIEVYFSKPISWKDYVLGKVGTIVIIGYMLTAVPALIIDLVHFVLAPSMQRFQETSGMVLPIILFSSCIVFSCALGVLASSALFSSQRFASIAVFMVLLANLTIVGVLSDILDSQRIAAAAYPFALNRIGEVLFGSRRPAFRFDWHWPVVYFALVCTFCAFIVCRKAKRAGEII
jgi:hypothetical protein